MPWKVYKNELQWCVHKLKSDGSKGKRVSCHDTRQRANAHLAKLNIIESNRKRRRRR